MRPTRTSARRGASAFVVIIAVALLSTATVFASDEFNDVPDDHPFHDDVTWAVTHGVAEGFSDGTYRPSQAVTRGAMAAFLHRLYDAIYPVPHDKPFHLIILCDDTTRFAVVQNTGALVRGSADTTSVKDGTGGYIVTFDIDVSACAFVANVGRTGNSGAESGWATVAGSTLGVDAVFVQTWDNPPQALN